jgi:hypothetical protein
MFGEPKQKPALKVIETLQNNVCRSVRYPKDKATSLQSKSGPQIDRKRKDDNNIEKR